MKKHRHPFRDFIIRLVFESCHKGRTTMNPTLTLLVDDTGAHRATVALNNAADGSVAQGVTVAFASDSAAVATIDPASGALSVAGIGVANISAVCSRGAFTHTVTGVLTVIADANTGDFVPTLALS
jgi:hypothetical protein